jgi:hypothetical protein
MIQETVISWHVSRVDEFWNSPYAPAPSYRHARSCQNHQHQACRLGDGGIGTCAGAAAGGLAEVGSPLVGMRRADRAADWIVWQHIGRVVIVPPHDVVGRIDRAVLVVIAGYETRHCGECHFAGGVQLGKIPSERTGNVERAGGYDAGPIEQIDRTTDLGGQIDIGSEQEFERAGARDSNARREGDRRVPRFAVEYQSQRAGGLRALD